MKIKKLAVAVAVALMGSTGAFAHIESPIDTGDNMIYAVGRGLNYPEYRNLFDDYRQNAEQRDILDPPGFALPFRDSEMNFTVPRGVKVLVNPFYGSPFPDDANVFGMTINQHTWTMDWSVPQYKLTPYEVIDINKYSELGGGFLPDWWWVFDTTLNGDLACGQHAYNSAAYYSVFSSLTEGKDVFNNGKWYPSHLTDYLTFYADSKLFYENKAREYAAMLRDLTSTWDPFVVNTNIVCGDISAESQINITLPGPGSGIVVDASDMFNIDRSVDWTIEIKPTQLNTRFARLPGLEPDSVVLLADGEYCGAESFNLVATSSDGRVYQKDLRVDVPCYDTPVLSATITKIDLGGVLLEPGVKPFNYTQLFMAMPLNNITDNDVVELYTGGTTPTLITEDNVTDVLDKRDVWVVVNGRNIGSVRVVFTNYKQEFVGNVYSFDNNVYEVRMNDVVADFYRYVNADLDFAYTFATTYGYVAPSYRDYVENPNTELGGDVTLLFRGQFNPDPYVPRKEQNFGITTADPRTGVRQETVIKYTTGEGTPMIIGHTGYQYLDDYTQDFSITIPADPALVANNQVENNNSTDAAAGTTTDTTNSEVGIDSDVVNGVNDLNGDGVVTQEEAAVQAGAFGWITLLLMSLMGIVRRK